jgi:hypothetical protein
VNSLLVALSSDKSEEEKALYTGGKSILQEKVVKSAF